MVEDARCGVIMVMSHGILFQMSTVQTHFPIFNSISGTVFLGKFHHHSSFFMYIMESIIKGCYWKLERT